MELRHLRRFIAVAEEPDVSRAAERLLMAQRRARVVAARPERT